MPISEELFPLASSPLASVRLSILAYLALGPATTGEVAAACAIDRVRVWRLMRELSASGHVVEIVARRFQIADAGVRELSIFHRDLSLIADSIVRNVGKT